MANIDGAWDSSAQSPMGPQNSTMTFASTGDGGFTGTSAGPMGTMDIADGTIDGDGITFSMKLTKPFPMTLKGEAKVSGDRMEGALDTGAFGKMPFTAVRKA